eukprot:TRINITY_DN65132_c0_g1_i1.p1 TRINITY_DN65132_c0_g1~~TRINITY_DN65132_c0_g1_i1.p1  ORF type:complete len:193 (-),score=16.56 TRINITY_DN65132_c0_g1_i1:128-706(-)
METRRLQQQLIWLCCLLLLDCSSALCPDGRCINCIYCNGDCYDSCSCYSDINMCCCASPPGHFSRGYYKVPCPGGSYQDELGQATCKPCNGTDALYDLTFRGATDPLDCVEALCQHRDVNMSNATQVAERCMTSSAVRTRMLRQPSDLEFCGSLTPAITESGCSWRHKTSSAYRAASGFFLSFILLVAMAIS